MPPDSELLRRYTDEHSEAAFTELVRRHVNLVYAAALRQTRGDAQLAEDVGQRVFTQLARKAGALTRHPALVGWLYRTTRFCAIDGVRARQRREAREREIETMKEISPTDEGHIEWEKLSPLLDDALAALGEADRVAVLLRFFEGKSFGELGGELGLSENAARMRVDRALDKLRRVLARRGCTSTVAALSAVLAGEAAAAAPVGWAAGVAPAALAAAVGAVGTGGALAGFSIFAMNKLTIALITGIAAAGLTTAGLNWKTRWVREENGVLRAENEALRTLKATRAAGETGPAQTLGELADNAKLTQLVSEVQHRKARTGREVAEAAAKAKPVLQNRGIGAPAEALETFTLACYTGDVPLIAKQVYFDGDARKLAEAMLARMPDYLRNQWKTPEELYAFFTAADCLVYPPPSDPEMLKKAQIVFLKSDRIAMRRPGATSGGQEFQWTQEGWKRVYPEQAIEDLAQQVLRTNPMPAPEPEVPTA